MGLKQLIPAPVRERISWQLSRSEIRRWMKSDDLTSVLTATRKYRGRAVYRSIYAIQRDSEIRQLTSLVQQLRPRVIVEIGTALGGTLYIWTRSNPTLELVVSIDLPGGSFGGGYDVRREELYREFTFRRPQTRMELFRCDSHALSTTTSLKNILAGRQVDFLWLDGDHTYDGVKADYDHYSPLVRAGGLVAFHDIVTRGDGHDVVRFWNEVKRTRPHREFVEDPNGDMGIGVLQF